MLLLNTPPPAQSANLALWLTALDLSSITKNGSAQVSAWADKSGKGNNAAQGTDANKPVYTASAINGRPALKCRNATVGSQLVVADHASLNYASCSLFFVFQRITDMGTVERMVNKYIGGANQREFAMQVNSDDVFGTTTSTTGANQVGAATTKTLALATPYIADFQYTGSVVLLRINNESATQGSTSTTLFNGTSDLTIGSAETISLPFDGYIGEVRMYNSVLTDSARMDVLRELSRTWGIAI